MSGAGKASGHWVAVRPYGNANSRSGFRITRNDGSVVATGFCKSDDDLRAMAAGFDLLTAIIYLRDCIESGRDPAMGDVNRAIAKATGQQS